MIISNQTNNSLKINIIFRTCDKVNAVHGSPRPFNLDKLTLIKICFMSLVEALKDNEHKIFIIADDISIELTEFFSKFNVTMIHGVFGNDNSLRKSFELAKGIDNEELIYFCEDDYLHTIETFDAILEVLNYPQQTIPGKVNYKTRLRKREITWFKLKRFSKKPELLVFPCDYPDRYKNQFLKKNFIFQTPSLHWRQIEDITFTFLLKAETFKKNYNTFIRSSNKANDRYLSKKLLGCSFFYKKILGLSPLPSLSCHMHVETMSAIVDWESLVNKYFKKIT